MNRQRMKRLGPWLQLTGAVLWTIIAVGWAAGVHIDRVPAVIAALFTAVWFWLSFYGESR